MIDKKLESHWTFSLQPAKRRKKAYKCPSPHVSVLSMFAASSWKFFKSCKAQKMKYHIVVYKYNQIKNYIYRYSRIWNTSPNWKIPKTTWREVPYFHVGNSLSGWYQGHSCVGHGTSSIIPLGISAMIAKNMCSKRYCIPKLLKKTTQVFTAQIIKFLSNRYAEMCISSGDLLFLSLLIARDLEANDLSKPAPVTGEEIYRNPGVKKNSPTGYQQNWS